MFFDAGNFYGFGKACEINSCKILGVIKSNDKLVAFVKFTFLKLFREI